MLSIVKFKGCKRCGGDLFAERDSDGTSITCLQCSAVYVKLPVFSKKKPNTKRIYAR